MKVFVRRFGIAWSMEWPSDDDTAMTSDAVLLKAIKDVHQRATKGGCTLGIVVFRDG